MLGPSRRRRLTSTMTRGRSSVIPLKSPAFTASTVAGSAKERSAAPVMRRDGSRAPCPELPESSMWVRRQVEQRTHGCHNLEDRAAGIDDIERDAQGRGVVNRYSHLHGSKDRNVPLVPCEATSVVGSCPAEDQLRGCVEMYQRVVGIDGQQRGGVGVRLPAECLSCDSVGLDYQAAVPVAGSGCQ